VLGHRGLFSVEHSVHRAAQHGNTEAVRRPGLERVRLGRRRVSGNEARSIRLRDDAPLGARRTSPSRCRPTTSSVRDQAG